MGQICPAVQALAHGVRSIGSSEVSVTPPRPNFLKMEASHERPLHPGVLGPNTKAKGHCYLLHQNSPKTEGCWGKGAVEAAGPDPPNPRSWVEMSQEVMSANLSSGQDWKSIGVRRCLASTPRSLILHPSRCSFSRSGLEEQLETNYSHRERKEPGGTHLRPTASPWQRG